MKVLALDPSTKSTGYALFEDKKLRSYGNVKTPKNRKVKNGIEAMTQELKKVVSKLGKIDIVICEIQTYRGAGDRMSPDNFAALQAVCYSCGNIVGGPAISRYWVTPITWNKGVPKHVTHQRVRKLYDLKLTSGEQDYLDAIGIGHYYWKKRGKADGGC